MRREARVDPRAFDRCGRRCVRSLDRIDELAEAGASRIALGTAVVRDPSFAEAAAVRYGELLVADVAARDGMVKVNGWREGAAFWPMTSSPAWRISAFDTGYSPTLPATACRRASTIRRIATLRTSRAFPSSASGGIASLRDIEKLARLEDGVVEGCITGRALYEAALRFRRLLRPLAVRRDALMLTKRVIPCLDVKEWRVVKGVNFVGLRDAGDPVELAGFLRCRGRGRGGFSRHNRHE